MAEAVRPAVAAAEGLARLAEALRAARADLADCERALAELESGGASSNDFMQRRMTLAAWHREARVRLATLREAVAMVVEWQSSSHRPHAGAGGAQMHYALKWSPYGPAIDKKGNRICTYYAFLNAADRAAWIAEGTPYRAAGHREAISASDRELRALLRSRQGEDYAAIVQLARCPAHPEEWAQVAESSYAPPGHGGEYEPWCRAVEQ